MTATPIYPFQAIRGGITHNHYCRMLHGKLIVQRKPCRQGHIPTPREAANQQLFASIYRVKKTSQSARTD